MVPGWGQGDAAHAGDVVVSRLVKELPTSTLNGRVYTPTSILRIRFWTLMDTKRSLKKLFTWCSPVWIPPVIRVRIKIRWHEYNRAADWSESSESDLIRNTNVWLTGLTFNPDVPSFVWQHEPGVLYVPVAPLLPDSPPPPPDSIMVGLTDDRPILLETGLDCPSLSLLSCLGRDLESPTETQRDKERRDDPDETTEPFWHQQLIYSNQSTVCTGSHRNWNLIRSWSEESFY